MHRFFVRDGRQHLFAPGLVDTHHHMFQSLTRAIPAVQNAELFGWLKGLYPIWEGLPPEMVRVSTQVAMAVLSMSGSMSVGQSQGGLPPDHLLERDDVILKDTQRVIEQYHDDSFWLHSECGGSPVFTVQCQPRPDAGICRAGAQSAHATSHPPSGKRPRPGLFAREIQLHTGRIRTESGLAGLRRWRALAVTNLWRYW